MPGGRGSCEGPHGSGSGVGCLGTVDCRGNHDVKSRALLSDYDEEGARGLSALGTISLSDIVGF